MNLVGQRVGSYIVDRELGSGGTGTVYLCKHTLIEREVAVKVLHDDQARIPDQVARFFQEAKAAAETGHPNIIVIIDFGTIPTPDGPRTYLMMESLDGESLDKRLQRGGLSLDDIAHILSQVASALVACHGKAIIHRDLKPSNIFLCDRSFDPLFVKLLDFGTAKLTAPVPGLHKTQYGVVIGTPAYMSPEQCEGKGAIDQRSDIYSLGVMLYEMLTGTLPFDGDLGDMLRGHMTQTPDRPTLRNPQVPHEWEALCLRMMEKARESRFQSVTELALAIADLRSHASAYDAFVGARAQSGHSGRTMIAPASQAGDQVTLRGVATSAVDISSLPSAIPPSETAAAVDAGAGASQPWPPLSAALDPASACAALVAGDVRASFARAIMLRPIGRWSRVAEVCHAASVSAPASLPPDLHVTWLPHPHDDPSLASVVFVSLHTGWSTVVLAPRVM
ncbi:MAG: serine/threonine protein kinase [Deltaproteobacteria bacterium]|nr:serine/threonine protein kinase [Deltaproteobacteria bacterium]